MSTESILNDWIGRGRRYKDPPKAVSDEVIRRVSISVADISSLLPGLPEATISGLLQHALPMESEMSRMPSPLVFSASSPNISLLDFLALENRFTPTSHAIQSLRNAAGQAILDGSQSIQCPATHSFFLPLNVLGLWDYLCRASHAQAAWKHGLQWMTTARGLDEDIISRTTAILDRVPWRGEIHSLTDSLSVTESASFLSNQLLYSDHVNAMLHRLAERVDSRGHTIPAVLVLPETLELLMNTTEDYPEGETSEIQRQGINLSKRPYSTVLVTVVWSHPLHWAAMAVDTRGETIQVEWGDSIGRRQPKQHVEGLRYWLEYHLGDRLTEFSNLKCAKQTDGFSCGIIAINTLKHLLFGDGLWKEGTRDALRLQEFCEIMEHGFPVRSQASGSPLASKKKTRDHKQNTYVPSPVKAPLLRGETPADRAKRTFSIDSGQTRNLTGDRHNGTGHIGKMESRGYMTIVLKASEPLMITPGAVTSLVKVTHPMVVKAPNSNGNYQVSSLLLHPLKRDGGIEVGRMMTLAVLTPNHFENVHSDVRIFPGDSYVFETAGGLELHLLFKFEDPQADAKMTVIRPWKLRKPHPKVTLTRPASLNPRDSAEAQGAPQIDAREAKKARKSSPTGKGTAILVKKRGS